jgi:toxoflavin synthase
MTVSKANDVIHTAYYDTIAEQYKKTKELPRSLHIDEYTYFTLVGDITGKSILDLACGEGFFTRKFKHQGATRAVGEDGKKQKNPLALSILSVM